MPTARKSRSLDVGRRAQLAPHTDAWMRGDRYGDIVGATKTHLRVKMDKSGRTLRIARSNIADIFEANPRVPCGVVSSSRNRYVGATFTKKRGAASGTRRVVGCAAVGKDEGYYATRKVGAKGTRYTPVKKRSLRDLRSTRKGAVKLAKIKGSTRTSTALAKAWEKRYAKAAPKRKAPKRKGKLTGAAKAEFLRRMAAGKRRAGR